MLNRFLSRGLTSKLYRVSIPINGSRFNSTIGSANTKRSATSLFNTTRTLADTSPIQITNKKYSEAGKLLTLGITTRAVDKLKSISQEENNPKLALRIGVESGGCHGFQYNLNLSDLSTVNPEEDCIFEKSGARIIIDDSSLSILRGCEVDYTTELIGSMFKVKESEFMSSSCGCGGSFDVNFDKIENDK
ncbi:hypothetical protein WICMUC_004065 [Wickerhamomyces mucosus]|uniref:Core domain-containing protein n=1 Tax=Wickerhamomyces mucosus TaxID=1378264 RepID=A0A9P8TAW7_9ASCO|nr:hypothetical protein WICMUC_004065 [Wickerhamomyces mucosus]